MSILFKTLAIVFTSRNLEIRLQFNKDKGNKNVIRGSSYNQALIFDKVNKQKSGTGAAELGPILQRF